MGFLCPRGCADDKGLSKHGVCIEGTHDNTILARTSHSDAALRRVKHKPRVTHSILLKFILVHK